MKQFHAKSIAFYLLTILFVVLLFRLVSHYGEQLQAPVNVNGRYISDRALPGCSAPFAVELQQSGIYLNGQIVEAASTESSSEERPLLSGLLQSQQLVMEGTAAIECAAAAPVQLQGSIRDAVLQGSVQLGDREPLQFVAQRAAATPAASQH